MNTMEFKFKAESGGIVEKEVEMRLSDTGYWHSVMEEFVCFLRGIGYTIPAGEYISDEELEDLRIHVISEATCKCEECSCGKEKEGNKEGICKD